ncbi:hypothetical protein C8R44DRAFT_927013 [Mycena epipterygia]|nr:hypothetical protein C8R44DRAFT_927013 [Mycena epipterygia]
MSQTHWQEQQDGQGKLMRSRTQAHRPIISPILGNSARRTLPPFQSVLVEPSADYRRRRSPRRLTRRTYGQSQIELKFIPHTAWLDKLTSSPASPRADHRLRARVPSAPLGGILQHARRVPTPLHDVGQHIIFRVLALTHLAATRKLLRTALRSVAWVHPRARGRSASRRRRCGANEVPEREVKARCLRELSGAAETGVAGTVRATKTLAEWTNPAASRPQRGCAADKQGR